METGGCFVVLLLMAAAAALGVLLTIPARGFFRAVRRRRARRMREQLDAGLCPRCGYDLRGTPRRCPECGAVVMGPVIVVRSGAGGRTQAGDRPSG